MDLELFTNEVFSLWKMIRKERRGYLWGVFLTDLEGRRRDGVGEEGGEEKREGNIWH